MTTVRRWNETNRHQQGGSWASNFCKPRSEYIAASLSPKRFLKSTVLCLSVPGLMSLPFFGLQMSSSPRHSAELLRKVLQLFLRYYNTNRAGNIISFDVWKQCYQAGTLRRIWIYQQIHEAVPGVWSTMEMLWRDMNLTGFRLAHARVWELLVEYFSLSATFPGQETGGLRLGWRATEATQSHSVSHPDMIPVSGAGGWSGMLSVTQRHREQPRPTISKPQLETRCSRVRECFFKSLMTFQSPESSAWQVSDLGFIAGYHGLATLRWAHNQVSQDESKVSIASNLRVSWQEFTDLLEDCAKEVLLPEKDDARTLQKSQVFAVQNSWELSAQFSSNFCHALPGSVRSRNIVMMVME